MHTVHHVLYLCIICILFSTSWSSTVGGVICIRTDAYSRVVIIASSMILCNTTSMDNTSVY